MEQFLDSINAYFSEFSFSSAVMLIMLIFMFIGAFDRIRGNKWGYGKQFEEGFNAMGPLALAMVGMLALAPVIKIVFEPLISPLYNLIGASPSTFPAVILSSDMGGYPLAMEMADGNTSIGLFSGLVLASAMGPTITFTIPVALSIINPNDRPYLSMGVMIALLTIPVGCFLGGLCMYFTPYQIGATELIINLLPTMAIIAVILFFLWRFPRATMNAFGKFGNFIVGLITAALALAVFQFFTGIKIPLLSLMVEQSAETGLSPLTESFLIIGSIGMILLGAFPMVHFITTKLQKPLLKVGSKLKMSAEDCSGIIASLANSIPMFATLNTMSGRGKLVNIAFVVSGSFVLGDHLGFTAGINPDMILPMMVGKFISGAGAAVLAWFLYDKVSEQLK